MLLRLDVPSIIGIMGFAHEARDLGFSGVRDQLNSTKVTIYFWDISRFLILLRWASRYSFSLLIALSYFKQALTLSISSMKRGKWTLSSGKASGQMCSKV